MHKSCSTNTTLRLTNNNLACLENQLNKMVLLDIPLIKIESSISILILMINLSISRIFNLNTIAKIRANIRNITLIVNPLS